MADFIMNMVSPLHRYLSIFKVVPETRMFLPTKVDATFSVNNINGDQPGA
jgi:hypothetical protein